MLQDTAAYQRLARVRRLLLFFYHQRIKGFAVPLDPHFDASSTEAFKDRIGRTRLYVEYGAGGSTLLAGRLGIRTISVESDRFFARRVRAALPASAKATVLDINLGMTIEWSKPVFRTPTQQRVKRWRRYVMAPFEQIGPGQGFPDFVLVDGRFRRACALEMARRAQVGEHPVTIMVDDYVGRPDYHVIEEYLGSPRLAGRAAFFEVMPAAAGQRRVPVSAVEEAMRDYR